MRNIFFVKGVCVLLYYIQITESDSNNENIEAEFDESIFTNLDSMMPISEEEKSPWKRRAKAKFEAEEAARKKAEEEHKLAEEQTRLAEEAARKRPKKSINWLRNRQD